MPSRTKIEPIISNISLLLQGQGFQFSELSFQKTQYLKLIPHTRTQVERSKIPIYRDLKP